MSSRGLGAVCAAAVLVSVGCGDEAAGTPVDFASRAVPSVGVGPAATDGTDATAPGDADEAGAVLAAYAEYVAETDRFVDESIAQAAAAGAFSGSPELYAILDAVAVGRIRDIDVQTPMMLWQEGGVATVGTPVVIEADVTSLDENAGTAELQTCRDLRSVDYLDPGGGGLKPVDVPGYLVDSVWLVRAPNPRNADAVRWYVENRVSQQVDSCG